MRLPETASGARVACFDEKPKILVRVTEQDVLALVRVVIDMELLMIARSRIVHALTDGTVGGDVQ
jgi:hypothetical protein